MSEDRVQKAIAEVLPLFKVDALKREQKTMLNCLLERKDCVAILPTGFGKSLPYEMLPLVKRKLSAEGTGKIIIASPLISLMEDQVTKLKKIPDYSVAFKGNTEEDDTLIKGGNIEVLFASPETLVGGREWRSVIQTFDVSLIVIDKFHIIVTWGGLGDEEETFREWFRHLGELRYMFPSANLLALSATCQKKIRKKVMTTLHMEMESTTLISVSPNKPNIKFVVKKWKIQLRCQCCGLWTVLLV